MARPVSHTREDGIPPASSLEGKPPIGTDGLPGAALIGMLSRELKDAMRETRQELRSDMKDLRADISTLKTHADNHFYRTLYIFGAGFVAVVLLFAWGYTRADDRQIASSSKTDDRIAAQGTALTRIDQKLEDLLARIPPVQAPAPHK